MDPRLASMESTFKALADGTRLRILGLLLEGEVCVCDIHESLRVSQPTVSRHLAYLRRAGLVRARRHGLWVHYRLATLDNDVLRTVVAAVGRDVADLEIGRRDRERLRKRTEWGAPAE